MALGARAKAGIAVAVLLLVAAGVPGWKAVATRWETADEAAALTSGNAERAPALLVRYGCAGCHTIPGVAGADGKVGPALAGLVQRVYIGDGLRNTPDNLAAWIVDPRRLSPRAAMPATGIGAGDARDVAAYLYQH